MRNLSPPNPESRVPSPESRVPSPESPVPSPEPRVPSPGTYNQPMSFRFAAVLQTPNDEHSAVYIAYRALAGHLAGAGNSLDILTPDDLNFQPRYGRLVPLVYPSAVRRW